MITDDAVKMVTGIENIEIFLEDNDEWQFHFSKVTEIHWNSERRALDVTINSPCCVGIEYDRKKVEVFLDFHFIDVVDLKWEYAQDDYADEISMKELSGFLETWFDFITLRVTSKGVVVDKPRFVPIKENDI
jgi:hypothetical protein